MSIGQNRKSFDWKQQNLKEKNLNGMVPSPYDKEDKKRFCVHDQEMPSGMKVKICLFGPEAETSG